MAELGETIRLVELICARLCHDLGGLIGTVSNAIDMVDDDADGENEVVAFASSAAKALMERLRLMRAAWGPDIDPLTVPELTALVLSPLAARRIAFETGPLPPGCVFPAPVARVLINLILLAADSLRKGGTVVLMGEPADLMVRIDGPEARWPLGLANCMRDEAAAIAALTGVRSVQMPLTALLALSRRLRLSPVLGPLGVEAVRLQQEMPASWPILRDQEDPG
jgi:histidine phosphotransferase ChpT